jgi:thiamine-phosphate pyrophosphorylase
VLLYYITDRRQFGGDEHARRHRLIQKIGEAARHGVDYIQLREKDLSTRDLEAVASLARYVIRENSSGKRPTRLLINSRTDVALAVSADGIHLRSDDISPSEARKIWMASAPGSAPTVSVSCHSSSDVAAAAAQGADLALFAPVFEKPDSMPVGLEALGNVCRHKVPVLALGGITLENAAACVEAGAAGIAAIRLFQQRNIAELMAALRRGT